jgi:hypothetical protein
MVFVRKVQEETGGWRKLGSNECGGACETFQRN